MSVFGVRVLMALAALLLALATALGAIASHALGASLDADALHSFETAVDYQFIHSLGLLAVLILAERQRSRPLLIGVALLLAGILLFCGGVYASSLGGPRWIASVAPTGGVCLIAAWLIFASTLLHQAWRTTR